MLGPCDLPGVRRLATEFWESLEEGELTIASSPATCSSKVWLNVVLDAFSNVAAQMGDSAPMRLKPLTGECVEPTPPFALALGFSETTSVSELMECFGREPVCILTVNCNQGLSVGWKTLFSDIARVYRTAGVDVRQRRILAILVGCTEFPPVGMEVGIKVRALWNAVRWEEFRLLAESMLASSENALVRAWRIAVYSASSNGSPDVAALLCREMPNSLSAAVERSLDALGHGVNTSLELAGLFVADQRWSVPPSAVRPWARGHIAGISLERGVHFNLKHMARAAADAYLRRAIWREQVSGLLPVVMEMGFSVNQTVTRAIGDGWLEGFSKEVLGVEGQVYLEPGEVIDRIKECGGVQVPQTLWRMLKLLRKSRNDLAHMRPIDYGRVRDLWQGYDHVRRRFSERVVS